MVNHTAFLTIAEEAVAHLKRMKHDYPRLVTPQVISALENWSRLERDRGSVGLVAKDLKAMQRQALETTAIELIGKHQLEDVLEILKEEFAADLGYAGLIDLVGEDRYRVALQSEAAEMKRNAVSFAQMAELWNGMGKPAFGNERWTKLAVSTLSD